MTLQIIDEKGNVKTYTNVVDFDFYDKDSVITELMSIFPELDFEEDIIDEITSKVKSNLSNLEDYATKEDFTEIVEEVAKEIISNNQVVEN